MELGFKGFPNKLLGVITTTAVKVLGKPGATAGTALAGATTSGAPTTGQFDLGDMVVGQNGVVWVCIAAGSPGTWASVAGGAQGSLLLNWRGGWSSSANYAVNDLTTYQYQLWVCGSANSNTTPSASSAYAASVLADSPYAFYHCADAVGASSALDSSGNGRNGTTSGVTFGGGGLLPNLTETSASVASGGSIQYPVDVNYGFGQLNAFGSGVAHEMWFRTSSTSTQGLVYWASAGSGAGANVGLNSSGQLCLNGSAVSTTAYNDGNVHHLVVNMTGSLCTAFGSGVTTAQFYVDTVNIGTISNSSSGCDHGHWTYGVSSTNGNWKGDIGEIAFWQASTLSSTRVTAHYNAAQTSPWILVALNPMTTQGDMIAAGSSAQPARVAAGASSTLLQGGTTPAFSAAPTVTGEVTASDFKPSGLTGATTASRYVGATTSGAPTSGTFAVGDFVITQNGQIWINTAAGTPGTWVQAGGTGSYVLPVATTTVIGGVKPGRGLIATGDGTLIPYNITADQISNVAATTIGDAPVAAATKLYMSATCL